MRLAKSGVASFKFVALETRTDAKDDAVAGDESLLEEVAGEVVLVAVDDVVIGGMAWSNRDVKISSPVRLGDGVEAKPANISMFGEVMPAILGSELDTGVGIVFATG